jgi:lysophospholipase
VLWVSGVVDGHRQGELSADDGVLIPYREWWQPEARGVIHYLHGQGDHSGPFTAMGDQLHSLGFNVYAHDHRGFGLSLERRGDIASYDLFIDDVMAMMAHARGANVGKPVYLLGQSMGGHLALRAAYRAGQQIHGVVALSPGFKLKTAPPWGFVLKTLLCGLLAPGRYMDALMDNQMTTRNKVHLTRANDDEHWVKRYTARFYVHTVRSIQRAKYEMQHIQVPVMILQAGDDSLTCPIESRRFFERIQHEEKDFRLLEGLCHNLVAEPEMPQIAKEIAQWIERRTASKVGLV